MVFSNLCDSMIITHTHCIAQLVFFFTYFASANVSICISTMRKTELVYKEIAVLHPCLI